MNVVERAAIAEAIRGYSLPGLAARIDALPVLSDADRAVLDAADAQERLHASYPEPWPCDCWICIAVRARRETQP